MLKRSLLASIVGVTLIWAPLPAEAETLPLQRVIISTSGLANFEHVGSVTGNEQVSLPVRLDQVDDLLKSLVIFDAQGRLGAVTLPGRQPLAEAFRDLPFDQAALNSPQQLLNALQGAEVSISGSTRAQGRILRVVPEQIRLPNNGGTITQHRLSIMGSNGLSTMVLEDLEMLDFVDETVRKQVDDALTALHQHRVQDQREINVSLLGDSHRPVRLSYVVEAPLWKGSYRLVLPQVGEDHGFMQGWAIFENTTGHDWEKVEVTLISGNPVTYRQSLYESYFVERPILPVQVLGRVLPRRDTGAIAKADDLARGMALAQAEAPQMRALARRGEMDMAAESFAMAAPSSLAMDSAYGGAAGMTAPPPAPMAPGAMAVQSEEATTQLLFRFPERFDLPSGHSMMIPFISGEMEMERVWLYQPDVQAQHPFAAIRLENTGETGLPPGILTIYEASAALGATNYVGDAELPVVPKGDERLISFALDNKTSIDREQESDRLRGVITLSQGILRQQITNVSLTHYTIKAPADEDRKVIIEQPRRSGWDLAAPNPDEVEVTATHYRIPVTVPAGETRPVSIRLENKVFESQRLNSLSSGQIAIYLGQTEDRNLRRAFETMADMQRNIERLNGEVNELQRQEREIIEDQRRIRDNLQRVGQTTDLGRRYVRELETQENQLAQLRDQAATKRRERERMQQRLEDYIAELDIK